ncbi:hypothetical protein ID866_5921 [Astraeus odoratus]|nr:hypothetical protein ID866_5921 [Astraeus odoratus]
MTAVQVPARSIPTLQQLGSSVDPNIDVRAIARTWFSRFVDAMISKDVSTILDLLLDGALWRDMLALTWDFHTYEGRHKVMRFLTDQLPKFDLSAFKLREDLVSLQMPYEDMAWIQGFFTFDTTAGHASGIFRLLPLADGSWKAHVVYTNLEDLKSFPEKIGALRNHEPNHGKWAEMRERERQFLDEEPSVVIVGGGQSGLEVAARLKMLGLNALVVERNKRIGDSWRNRYAAMCLHDTVWYDHMPYLPFPPSWPVHTPALKLADWLESYAQSLELNVWTSTEVVSVEPSTTGKKWSVKVGRNDGTERIFNVNHVVFAMGFSSGNARIPTIPGREEFKGLVLHSSQHKFATDHQGKKVAVIGSCTSAHDLCSDYVDHGIDVTMVQRGPTYVMSVKEGLSRVLSPLYSEGGPPTDLADRINASFPYHAGKLLFQRTTRAIAEADKDTLDGLRKVGFKLTLGEDDTGILPLIWRKLGGYYFDVGASQKIIDGRIKLKSDGLIARYTSSGLLFKDGSTLEADVILFSTGYGDARDCYLRLLPRELHNAVLPAWQLNEEGEMNSVGREIGGRAPEGRKLAGLWVILGNFQMCRFHSKHIALQIKAYEEGIFGDRY